MKLKNATPIEDAKSCPNGRGTTQAYSVEARFNYFKPKAIGDVVFDNRWRPVPWHEAAQGIPHSRHRGAELLLTRLLTRHEAEALRWATICAADATDICGSLCLETRIVQHKVEYSYSATPVAYLDAFDGRGDLPKEMEPEPAPAQPDAEAT